MTSTFAFRIILRGHDVVRLLTVSKAGAVFELEKRSKKVDVPRYGHDAIKGLA
jgi:hypothetical protein